MYSIYWSYYSRSSVLQDIYPKCIKMCIINSIADSNEPLGYLRYIMSISLHIRLPGVQQAGFEHERCHRCPRLNFKLLVILRSMEFENNDVSMVIMDLYLNAKCFQYLRTNCSNQCKLRMLPREIILGSGPCKEANWANHYDNLWSWTRITCTKTMSLPAASVSVIDSEMWKWLIDHWLWFTNDSSDTNFPLLSAQNMLLIQFDVINRSLVRRLKQFNLEDSWAANSPCYYHIAKAYRFLQIYTKKSLFSAVSTITSAVPLPTWLSCYTSPFRKKIQGVDTCSCSITLKGSSLPMLY